jgi:hypothetical protein
MSARLGVGIRELPVSTHKRTVSFLLRRSRFCWHFQRALVGKVWHEPASRFPPWRRAL